MVCFKHEAVFHKFYLVHPWTLCPISNVGTCGDVLQKMLKPHDAKFIAQIYQSVWILLIDLELMEVKNLPSWNTTDLTYMTNVIVMNNYIIFFFTF